MKLKEKVHKALANLKLEISSFEDVQKLADALRSTKEKLLKARDDEDPFFDEDDASSGSQDWSDSDLAEAGTNTVDADGDEVASDPEDQEQDEFETQQSIAAPKDAEDPELDSESDQEEGPSKEDRMRGSYQKWNPRSDYSPKQLSGMSDLMSQGFSMREAERIVGAHSASGSLQDVIKARVEPHLPSKKMLEELRPHLDNFIKTNFERKRNDAKAAENPTLFAAGKAQNAAQVAGKSFEQALDQFKQSDDFKKIANPIIQKKAINDFKNKWHQSDEGKQALSLIHSAGKAQGAAMDAAKVNQLDKIKHVIAGGNSGEEMSAQVAGQMLGLGKDDDGNFNPNVEDNAGASFIRNNKIDAAKMKQLADNIKAKLPDGHEKVQQIQDNLDALESHLNTQMGDMQAKIKQPAKQDKPQKTNSGLNPNEHLGHLYTEWLPYIDGVLNGYVKRFNLPRERKDDFHEDAMSAFFRTMGEFSHDVASKRATDIKGASGEVEKQGHMLASLKNNLKENINGVLQQKYRNEMTGEVGNMLLNADRKVKDVGSVPRQQGAPPPSRQEPMQAPPVKPAQKPSVIVRKKPGA